MCCHVVLVEMYGCVSVYLGPGPWLVMFHSGYGPCTQLSSEVTQPEHPFLVETRLTEETTSTIGSTASLSSKFDS